MFYFRVILKLFNLCGWKARTDLACQTNSVYSVRLKIILRLFRLKICRNFTQFLYHVIFLSNVKFFLLLVKNESIEKGGAYINLVEQDTQNTRKGKRNTFHSKFNQQQPRQTHKMEADRMREGEGQFSIFKTILTYTLVPLLSFLFFFIYLAAWGVEALAHELPLGEAQPPL